MSDTIKKLQPTALWSHFADLNAVPRPSKKEERVIAFMKSFGEGLGLPTMVDKVGNVIIKKPAARGMQDCQTVVLQSHIDMVHQKNGDTIFDFDTQGIEMYVDGDWVKAKGTTLGADNGIGVAAIMAILSSTDIPHPPIEALFTIDEETGMTGALNLEGGLLDGRILLNLDTEEDTELTIGCAGGIDMTAKGKYESTKTDSNSIAFTLSVKGLTGGHSGGDIHLGRGNANKIMNRILYTLNNEIGIVINSIDGGSLRNAIPRESVSVVLVDKTKEAQFQSRLTELIKIIKAEYALTDAQLDISISETTAPETVMNKNFQDKLLRAVYCCPYGIYRMSPAIKGLVQSSNNLARVLVKDASTEVR